jgi:hypothetical protein
MMDNASALPTCPQLQQKQQQTADRNCLKLTHPTARRSKMIFALTEAGSVRAVMPGACGTLGQPTKNISQDPLLKGLNCCLRRLHLSYLAERKWLLYKKDPKRERA